MKPTVDRVMLEEQILPQYAAMPDVQDVLFIGLSKYTSDYYRRIFADKIERYVTMDRDPAAARFGSLKHVVAEIKNLSQELPDDKGAFDLVVFNGVYGWGLNSLSDMEDSLEQIHWALRDDGHLLFGWNDVPARDPAPLSAVTAFNLFTATGPDKLTNTPLRHTYRYLKKRSTAAEAKDLDSDPEYDESIDPPEGEHDDPRRTGPTAAEPEAALPKSKKRKAKKLSSLPDAKITSSESDPPESPLTKEEQAEGFESKLDTEY